MCAYACACVCVCMCVCVCACLDTRLRNIILPFLDFSFCLQMKKAAFFAPTLLLKVILRARNKSLFYFPLQQLATSPEVG